MSQPIRILYVSSVHWMGGAEVSLIQFAEHLDRQRFAPYLVTSREGLLTQRFRQAGLDVKFAAFPYPFRRYRLPFWISVARLVLLAKQIEARVFHVNCDKAIPHAVAASRLTGIPCVCHIHDVMRAWFEPRYVSLLNRSQRIIANSQATAQRCREAGMAPEKVQVIYEPIEYEKFMRTSESDRQAVRSEFGIASDSTAIGLVAVIAPHKGHEDLLRAAVIVLSEFPNARFVIVGDDSLWPDQSYSTGLKELSRTLGITSAVHFDGFRTDMPRVMAALDILAVPSQTEAFGKVAAEAMASGKPVVGYRVGGIPEVVQDGITGSLCMPEDLEALAAGILALCRDARLRIEMGARGREAAAKFDVRLLTQDLQQLYESFVQDRP